ncbi:MAG: efflux RND transporter periplasmic adaptor subunit [Clostridia bacterium]|nr:efflux RND transporter periplasmic adaptor subunit [Clostridia bacterium]
MKRWIRNSILIIVVFCMLIFVLTSCGIKKQGDEGQEEGGTDAVSVEIEEVQLKDIQVAKELSGKLEAGKEIMVVPKIPGPVKKVNVKVGQAVKEGEVLIELEGSDVDMQIKQAQAAYDAASANIQLSKKQLDELAAQKNNLDKAIGEIDSQIKKMDQVTEKVSSQLSKLSQQLQKGEITQQQFQQELTKYIQNNVPDEYKQYLGDISGGMAAGNAINLSGMVNGRQQLLSKKAELEGAKIELESKLKLTPIQQKAFDAQLEQAKIGVDMAESAGDNLKLKSPIDGIVASLTVEKGEMAVQNMPPATVVDASEVTLDVNLTEFEVNKVEEGQKVDVVIEALDDSSVSGVIDYISPTLDIKTQSYPACIKIDNPDGIIKSGMFAKTSIKVDEKKDCIAVPKKSILDQAGNSFVFIIDGDRAKKVQVEIGIQDQEYVEILSGLNGGEKVITKGKDFLSDGAKIKIVRGED